MTKTVKKIVCGALVVVAILCSGIRISGLNTAYPSPVLSMARENEQLEFFGCNFTLQGVEIYSDEELMERYGLNLLVPYYELYERKTLVFQMSVVRNDATSSEYMNLSYLTAESQAWTNGVEPSLFEMLNDNPGSIGQLEMGKEYTYYIPVELFNVQFSPENWLQLNGREFSMVFSVYPEKIIMLGDAVLYDS